MNIQVLKSAWRRIKKPSTQSLAQLRAADPNFWPDYSPLHRVVKNPVTGHIAHTIIAPIGKPV